MTDKGVLAENRELNRKQLVRANFEAYRDLEWAKNLEPKFRQYNLDTDDLRRYRAEWNAHTEKRDWDWWLHNVKDESNDKLSAEIAECMEEIKALGRRLPARDQPDSSRPTFRDILDPTSDQPVPNLTQTQTRSNHR